jgi:hypothetical protein
MLLKPSLTIAAAQSRASLRSTTDTHTRQRNDRRSTHGRASLRRSCPAKRPRTLSSFRARGREVAGNKVPTPAELEAIRVEFKRRERSGSVDLAARNAGARAFWIKVDGLVDARMKSAPSAVKAAVDRVEERTKDGVPGRWILSLEERLVGDEVRNNRKQSALGRKNRPKAESPFTAFIIRFLKRNAGASGKDIEAALLHDARGWRTLRAFRRRADYSDRWPEAPT